MKKIYLTSLQLRELGKKMELSEDQMKYLTGVVSITIKLKGIKLINIDLYNCQN